MRDGRPRPAAPASTSEAARSRAARRASRPSVACGPATASPGRGHAREPLLGPGAPRVAPATRGPASPAPPCASPPYARSAVASSPRASASCPMRLEARPARARARGCPGRAPRRPRAHGRPPPPSRSGRPQHRRRATSSLPDGHLARRAHREDGADDERGHATRARPEPHAKSRLRKTSALSDEQRRRVARPRARPRSPRSGQTRLPGDVPEQERARRDVDVQVGDDACERPPAGADGAGRTAWAGCAPACRSSGR